MNKIHFSSSAAHLILDADENYVTYIIQPYDPRSSNFAEAIEKERKGLENIHTRDIVPVKKLPFSANVPGERFVLNIEGEGFKNEIWKACIVVQSYKEKMMFLLAHNIFVARRNSTKMLNNIAAVKKLRLLSADKNQTFIRNEEEHQRGGISVNLV